MCTTPSTKKCLLIVRSILYISFGMPKHEVKVEKPRKRLGKKELLIPPAAMGISLLTTLVIIPAHTT